MRNHLFSIVFFLFLSLNLSAQEVPWDSFFYCQGQDIIANSNGQKCVFRGISLPGMEYGTFTLNSYTGTIDTDFFKPLTSSVQVVKQWGLNCIRVPFEWARVVNDPNYLAYLDQVIDDAQGNHIYVILEMHDFLKYWNAYNSEIFVNNDTNTQTLLKNTWRTIASRYAANKTVLGYEIMNEPLRDFDGNWHGIAQEIVNSIREVDQNHLILLDGRNYSLSHIWIRDNGETAFINDPYSRIVYTPHLYFDKDNNSDYQGSPLPSYIYYIRDRIFPVYDWSKKNNVPVWYTEVGIPNTTEWKNVLDWAFINFYNPAQISVCYWLYDPLHSNSPLNVIPPNGQEQILQQHPGGVYTQRSPIVVEPESPLYKDDIVLPWKNASWPDNGQGFINWAKQETGRGNVIEVSFQEPFAGIKFYHEFIDITRYTYLGFYIQKPQNYWIYSEGLDGTESQKVLLSNYVVADNTWKLVKIPLSDILLPGNTIVTAIVFQNRDSVPPAFCIDDISLIREKYHDFNADGKSDMMWRHTDGTNYVWLMNGNTIDSSGAINSVDNTWNVLGCGDFDGDGKADLFWQNDNGTNVIWLMDGLQIKQSAALNSIGAEWSLIGCGDFDADGKCDLLWHHTGGTNYIWLMDGLQIKQSGAINSTDSEWQVWGAGDFDADNKCDLFWHHTGGTNVMWLMDGMQIKQSAAINSTDPEWKVVGTGDFDGNAKADLLWRHDNGSNVIWLMNGLSIDQSGLVNAVGNDWAVVGVGDFDADKKADIVWRKVTSGDNLIYFMDGFIIDHTGFTSSVDSNWTLVGYRTGLARSDESRETHDVQSRRPIEMILHLPQVEMFPSYRTRQMFIGNPKCDMQSMPSRKTMELEEQGAE